MPPLTATSLLEIAVDDLDQLIGRLSIECFRVFDRINEMSADVILDDLSQKAVDGPTAPRNELHNLRAARLTLESSFDRVNLSTDATHPVEQLLLLADRVAHGSSFDMV